MASTQQSQCHPDTDSKNEMEVVDQKKRGRTKQKAKCHCLALCSFAFNFENSQQSRQAIRNALLKWKQCKWWQQWKLLGSAETVIPTTCWNKPILPWKGAKKMKYIYIFLYIYSFKANSLLSDYWRSVIWSWWLSIADKMDPSILCCSVHLLVLHYSFKNRINLHFK